MFIQFSKTGRRTITLLTILVTLVTSATQTIFAQTKPEGRSPLTIPKRRPVEGTPALPPPLPASANGLSATTLEFVVMRTGSGGGSSARHTVSRTVDRIHLVGTDRREWLFERNPVDPRRVSATLVDHAEKAVIIYSETDLRIALGIRGWADVLAFGFDAGSLSDYRKTADVRVLSGIRFDRYVAAAKPGSVNTDVWWSSEQALASRFTVADSGVQTRFSLERVQLGANPALLESAVSRYPQYRAVAYPDWLEKH
jgi:hypothetical protein